MMHNDPLNPTGPNEMLFVGQTRVHPHNDVLVAGAHWHLLANTIEPSVVPAKRQERIHVPQHVHMQ